MQGKKTPEVARELFGPWSVVSGYSKPKPRTLKKGQLRIPPVTPLSIVSWWTGSVASFIAKWPEVSIDIVSTDQTVNLVESRIDLVPALPELTPNIASVKQPGKCRSVICASPQYLKEKGTPSNAQDLAHHNCLSFSYFGKPRTFNGPNGLESVPIKGNISANTSEVLLSATLKGNGISILPFPSVESLIQDGLLVPLLPEWQPKTLGVHAVYGTRKQVTRC